MRVLDSVLVPRIVSVSCLEVRSMSRVERLCFGDADPGVAQQPHDRAMVIGAVAVEDRAVLKRAQEVVWPLVAARRLECPGRIPPRCTLRVDEELGLLEIAVERPQRPDHPTCPRR